MPPLSILGGINQEATQQELLGEAILLLAAILERLPRVDAADRMLVSHAESNPTVAIAAAQTLATLTTAADVTRINNFGASATTSKPADAIPMHVANAGVMHIYDNIRAS